MTEEKYAAAGRPAENKQFCILSAIAMVLVVMGHVDEGLLTISGLFPYYSFHIALFVFISGYFFRPEDVYRPLQWLERKALRLLLPYFLWNVLYGMLVMLLRACGFFIGNEPSLRTLFVEPILSGHQFLYNAPAWFVTALFLTEAADLAIRRLFGWAEKGWTGLARGKRTERPAEETAHVPREQTEWLFMGLYLCLGFAVAWLSARGSVYDWYRVPGRIMYMLPCYQMGRLYRVSLEKRDTLPDGLYFGILLCVQLAVARFCRGECGVVQRFSKRSGDSVSDSGRGNRVLAAGERAPDAGAGGNRILALSGAQYLCGNDASAHGASGGEGRICLSERVFGPVRRF